MPKDTLRYDYAKTETRPKVALLRSLDDGEMSNAALGRLVGLHPDTVESLKCARRSRAWP